MQCILWCCMEESWGLSLTIWRNFLVAAGKVCVKSDYDKVTREGVHSASFRRTFVPEVMRWLGKKSDNTVCSKIHSFWGIRMERRILNCQPFVSTWTGVVKGDFGWLKNLTRCFPLLMCITCTRKYYLRSFKIHNNKYRRDKWWSNFENYVNIKHKIVHYKCMDDSRDTASYGQIKILKIYKSTK